MRYGLGAVAWGLAGLYVAVDRRTALQQEVQTRVHPSMGFTTKEDGNGAGDEDWAGRGHAVPCRVTVVQGEVAHNLQLLATDLELELLQSQGLGRTPSSPLKCSPVDSSLSSRVDFASNPTVIQSGVRSACNSQCR